MERSLGLAINEGADRQDMKLPFEQDSLLKAVVGENRKLPCLFLGQTMRKNVR